MNRLIALSGLSLVLCIAGLGYLSYTGLGLPTQNDPLSLREESVNRTRHFRGGTNNFGK